MIGRATRLSRYVADLDKSYTATARFGAVSDTLDADGNIAPLDAPMPDETSIRGATEHLTGEILQTPPMASAVKVGGARLYDLHRRGVTVERAERPATVHDFELTALDAPAQTATFDVRCGGGTYVRALISDLATSLGTGAYLTALRRTSVGHLRVRDAATPDDLTLENLHNHIIPPNEVVRHLPSLEVGAGEGAAVCNGRVLRGCELVGSFRVECGGGLLAVYGGDGAEARAEVVLCGG